METTTFKMEQWFNQDLQKPLNFSLWKIEDVEHDFPLLISEAQAKLDHILNQTMSDSILNFETIEAIITCSEKIDFVWNVLIIWSR